MPRTKKAPDAESAAKTETAAKLAAAQTAITDGKAAIAQKMSVVDEQLKETKYGELQSDIKIVQGLYESVKELAGDPLEEAAVSAGIGKVLDSIKNTDLKNALSGIKTVEELSA